MCPESWPLSAACAERMNKMEAGGRDGIGAMFDSISGTYDLLNHGLSFNIDKRWRRKAVRMLAPCGELLDVAVGTGDLAFEIIRQGKAEHVTGADLSVEMMRIGRERRVRGTCRSAFRSRRPERCRSPMRMAGSTL